MRASHTCRFAKATLHRFDPIAMKGNHDGGSRNLKLQQFEIGSGSDHHCGKGGTS